MGTKVSAVITILVLFLTTFQGMIPAIPISNPSITAVVSAIVMYLVSTLTVWKQYTNKEIANKSLNPTLIVAIVATLTGIVDLFKIIDFNHVAGQWIRFGFTFIIMFLNILSKIMYPTEETRSKL